jgi:SAM-dependent methyltransferase
MMNKIRYWLMHPLTRDLSVDSPETTLRRRQIIREKAFLNAIYREWYGELAACIPQGGRVLEVGSGAGFIKEVIPGIITSEVFIMPGVDLVADACCLPMGAASLDGILMTDVFHHIPNVADFLHEAARCVKPGGRLVMVEPWRTTWSEWVYQNLHPEPFEPESDWNIPLTGPLSGANGALPWIVFDRDLERFSSEYTEWRVSRVSPIMPFSYLLSGGVSMRISLPGWLYPVWRYIERNFLPSSWSMFALIELERK